MYWLGRFLCGQAGSNVSKDCVGQFWFGGDTGFHPLLGIVEKSNLNNGSLAAG
jgi:hypothetical protein